MRALAHSLVIVSLATAPACCPAPRPPARAPTAREVAAELARSPELLAEVARLVARAGASAQSPRTVVGDFVQVAAPVDPPAPAAFERFLQESGVLGQPFARYEAAVRTRLGETVRWRLRFWGGEISGGGFRTPRGTAPTRIRLVSPVLGPDANLATVNEAGHPVVACVSRDGVFARSGGPPALVPAVGAVVTIEATIWGVTDEGGKVLWMRDCAVVPDR